MKKITKFGLFFTVVICQFFLYGFEQSQPEEKPSHNEMIILENVPEISPEITGNQLTLSTIQLYPDGHYEAVSENLNWVSSNKDVATVDETGTVTFTGTEGLSFIEVSNGRYQDVIPVMFNQPYTFEFTGGNPNLIALSGEKYQVLSHATSNMSLEEKIGQMLMPEFRSTGGEDITEMVPEVEQTIKDYHLGGVILFQENLVTTEQTTKLLADYQQAAEKYGLLLTSDQEGGVITRLQSGTNLPGNMALGAARSAELSRKAGNVIGEELASLGINMNLAPVLDINNNPDNPVIGVRSFSESPELAAEMGVAFTKGLQTSGVAATAKHFPGHGDTTVDSHLGLPEVTHGKERLMETELYPFQQAMEAGIDAVMTAHITFPKIEDTKVTSKKDGTEIALPATLSPKVLKGLMREDMGYQGVIITDALNMNAIAEHFGPVDAAVRAVKAGADILLMPVGVQSVAEGLYEAVETGEIDEERIEESVKRILTLKLQRGIVKQQAPQPVEEKIAAATKTVGSKKHQQIETDVAEQAVTLVKNDDVLPLNGETGGEIVVVGSTYIDRLYQAVSAQYPETRLIKSSGPLSASQLQTVQEARAIIAGSYTLEASDRHPESAQMQLINQLIDQTDAPVISVGIRNPYDISAYPEIDGYLVQYSFRSSSFAATAAVLFGKIQPSGKLPVTIPDNNGRVLYELGHGLTY